MYYCQNFRPHVTFDTPKADARTTFNIDGERHGQREILESRDTRQVPKKRCVEIQSQNRDSLIRDVCTCLAQRANVSLLQSVPKQVQNNALGKRTLVSEVEERTPRCFF